MKYTLLLLSFFLSFTIQAETEINFDISFNKGFSAGLSLGQAIGNHECKLDMPFDNHPYETVDQSVQLLPEMGILPDDAIEVAKFKDGFSNGFESGYEIYYHKCEERKRAVY